VLLACLQEAEVLEAVADLATHRRQTHGAGGFLNANLEAMQQQRRGSDSANDDSPAAQLARSSRGPGRGAAAPGAGGGSAGGAVPGLEMGALTMTAGAGGRVSSSGGGVGSEGGAGEQGGGGMSVSSWLAERAEERQRTSQHQDAGHLPPVAS
jgi:hypothetical protein